MTGRERMTALARSFPTLAARAEGVDPWNAEVLDGWACGPVPGSGALHAARFVLAVWNGYAKWECGPYLAVEAMSVWDREHRSACVAWATDPWWP